MIREHAEAFGSHTITNIYEIVDDVTPAEVRRRVAALDLALDVEHRVRQARERDPAPASQPSPWESASVRATASARVKSVTACS